jgi:hypothetical protein
LITQSEYFGAWTGFGGSQTITDNYAISPEGLQNAARVQLERSPSLSRIQLSATGTTNGVSCVFSVYLKANSGSPYVYLQAGPNVGTAIEVTNEWERYDLVGTASGGTTTCIIGISDSVSGTTETADILVYGAQLESSASYVSSYIPTMGTSETRAADSCSVTGVSDVIGQTEGTLFLDFKNIEVNGTTYLASLDNGTSNERIELFNYLGNISVSVRDGGVQQVNMISSVQASGNHKIAFAYKQNDFALYIDGAQISLDTSGTLPTINEIKLYGRYDGANGGGSQELNQAALFNERLSNAELAALTA